MESSTRSAERRFARRWSPWLARAASTTTAACPSAMPMHWSRWPRPAVSPAPSDGPRGRMAADQDREWRGRHDCTDRYVRIAARTGLDLDDQRPERVAGDEKAALHKLRRALELAVLVLDGNHPVVADRVERADETVPPDLAQAR